MPSKGLSIAIATIIITVALVFSGLLILGKNYNPNSVAINEPPILGTESNSISNSYNPELFTQPQDATKQLAQQISQEIAVAAKTYDAKTNPEMPAPEEIVNRYLTEAVNNFDYEGLKPEITDSQLRIINQTSPSLTKNYIDNYVAIIKRDFSGLVIELENPDSPSWDRLRAAYEKALTELYDLPVPKNMVAIAKEAIALITAQQKMADYVQNYKNDPMTAWLAVQAYQNINAEFETLTNNINKALSAT